MNLPFILALLIAAPAVYLFSALVCRHAVTLKLIDTPNKRSSHALPTPSGGGIAIAIVFLLLLVFLSIQPNNYDLLHLAILGAGTLIALVGFIDDRSHIPAHKRLLVHFLAAGWVVYCIYIKPISHTSDLYLWVTSLFFMIFLVWLLNLYNFMDGIDAITSSETITVTLPAAFITWYVVPHDPSWMILLLLVVSTVGFTFWNLPPAKLFMGDSGSAFLGIVIGALILHTSTISKPLFYAWIILLGVYLVDATVTLIRRLITGQKIHQAHRSHAYQHAALRFQSHGKVSLVIALINIVWLMPAAWAVTMQQINGPLAITITFTPLIFLAIYFKAGKPQSKDDD
ncbi:MAG: glycosyltransferase family 4 protein [Candidatus Thiodiazotropha sp. (ex Semelilucina semeliformis)]|nr:glycosyltransferase family 4 protein [Candidatus Thiodiazotropha sp. (ex Semelilucina semeliformis)]